MLKFLQNIINSKVSGKFRLKYLYFFVKLNALAHFTYVEQRKQVRFSSISTLYGWVWVLYYFLLLTFYSFYLSKLLNEETDNLVLFFVTAIELITTLLKVFVIYFLRIIQSKNLVLLINDAIKINEIINYQDCHHFFRLYNFKKWCVLLQCVLIFGSYYNFIEQNNSDDTIAKINIFLIIYTHFSTVVVSGLFSYGGLLLGYAFYHSLNRKLINILTKIEVENYYQSDDFDEISHLYSRITSYVTSVNRMFSIQIIIELIGSFVLIICAVSILIDFR